jgi:cell division protein FtsL
MRRSTLFFGIFALALGFVLLKVKHEVLKSEQELFKTTAQIHQEKEHLHILKAEWTHLNEPQRLKKLAIKYLDIQPIKKGQVAAILSPTKPSPIPQKGVQ